MLTQKAYKRSHFEAPLFTMKRLTPMQEHVSGIDLNHEGECNILAIDKFRQ